MTLIPITQTQEEYNEYLTRFFNDNYPELYDIAVKTTKNTEFEADDLIAELLVYLSENKNKISNLQQNQIDDRTLMRFIAQWCYNQIRLYSPNVGLTNFKAKYQNKRESEVTHHYFNRKLYTPTDEQDLWLIDNLSPEDATRLKTIDNIISNHLTPSEIELYKMVFVNDLSIQQIRQQLPTLSRYILKQMITELKNKVRRLIEEENENF